MITTSVRTVLASIVIAVVASLAAGTAGADVSQTPGATGCPTGYARLSVASFETAGPYYLPRQVDTAGNNDGYVCAHVQPDSVRDAYCKQGAVVACQLQVLGLPHYLFTDDDSPAAK
jgi:hypothetical protein